MATLADLKARVTQETVRDDLADDMAGALDGAIRGAIADFEWERWWFNEALSTLVCTPGNLVIPYPTDVRRIDVLRLPLFGYRLTLRGVDWIEAMSVSGGAGQPTDYAVLNNEIRLWPTPNAAYQVLAEEIVQVTPPLTGDTSSNAWTNEGADLIVARTKKRLYRDYLSATVTDPRVQNAQVQEDEAYTRLRSQSNRRIATDRVAPAW